jgi:hypothetical protein
MTAVNEADRVTHYAHKERVLRQLRRHDSDRVPPARNAGHRQRGEVSLETKTVVSKTVVTAL